MFIGKGQVGQCFALIDTGKFQEAELAAIDHFLGFLYG